MPIPARKSGRLAKAVRIKANRYLVPFLVDDFIFIFIKVNIQITVLTFAKEQHSEVTSGGRQFSAFFIKGFTII